VLRLLRQDRVGLHREGLEVRRRPRRDEGRQDDAGQGGVQAAGIDAGPQRNTRE